MTTEPTSAIPAGQSLAVVRIHNLGRTRSIFEFNNGSFSISSCDTWRPGSFDSKEAAEEAFDLRDVELALLQQRANRYPEHARRITLQMVQAAKLGSEAGKAFADHCNSLQIRPAKPEDKDQARKTAKLNAMTAELSGWSYDPEAGQQCWRHEDGRSACSCPDFANDDNAMRGAVDTLLSSEAGAEASDEYLDYVANLIAVCRTGLSHHASPAEKQRAFLLTHGVEIPK